jgi:hypothetical protein
MEGHVARMKEGRSAFKILTGAPAGKRPLWSPRRRCENNIRIDLKEIGINTKSWVDSAQDKDYWRAIVNATLNLRVPQAMEFVYRATMLLEIIYKVLWQYYFK